MRLLAEERNIRRCVCGLSRSRIAKAWATLAVEGISFRHASTTSVPQSPHVPAGMEYLLERYLLCHSCKDTVGRI